MSVSKKKIIRPEEQHDAKSRKADSPGKREKEYVKLSLANPFINDYD